MDMLYMCGLDRGGEVTFSQLIQVFDLQQPHCENFQPCEKEG